MKLPIYKIEIILTNKQTKELEIAQKLIEKMYKKNCPGMIIAQVYPTKNEYGILSAPHMQCSILPSYLAKRIIKTIRRAMNPGNKIPRRNYMKAVSYGILKYINSKPKRKIIPEISEENECKAFGGNTFSEEFPDEDIPF